MKRIYIIGSLRNPKVPVLAETIRKAFGPAVEVFDDWFAAGPEADDYWKTYEQGRGRVLEQAMEGHAVNHVYRYDRIHLIRADIVVLALPAGKSGHLEFGFACGLREVLGGKACFIFREPQEERWDAMYRFADTVATGTTQLLDAIGEKL